MKDCLNGEFLKELKIFRTLEDMVTEDQYADFYNTHGLGGAGNYGTQSNHYFNQGKIDFYNTHGLGGAGNYGTRSNHYFKRRERGEYV